MNNLINKSFKTIKNQGWGAFFKKVENKIGYSYKNLGYSYNNFLLKNSKNNSISKLQKFESDNSEQIFDFAWNFKNGVIRPIQIKEEFLELLKIFKEHNPKYILEIGTANGGTLFSYCKLAREDAVIISIDLPEGLFGGGYSEWKIPIYEAFKKSNQKLYLLREDSHQKKALEKVKEILDGNQLDFLFIDGDHSFEGVKKDFEMYSPLVRKEGIIAFHDIVRHPKETGCEIEKLWNNIKTAFQSKEIIQDINQNWAGIGILIK